MSNVVERSLKRFLHSLRWVGITTGINTEISLLNPEREQKKLRDISLEAFCKSVAATYSPTWWGSTIGDGELNFSVRNGKRWILTAITATIYVLRKNNSVSDFRAYLMLLLAFGFISLLLQLPYFTENRRTHRGRSRAISTARL